MHRCLVLGSKPMAFTPIPAEDKLAAYLKRLATGACLFYLAQEFDMSVSAMCYAMSDVSCAICEVFADEVRWPTRDEALASVARFAACHKIPGESAYLGFSVAVL